MLTPSSQLSGVRSELAAAGMLKVDGITVYDDHAPTAEGGGHAEDGLGGVDGQQQLWALHLTPEGAWALDCLSHRWAQHHPEPPQCAPAPPRPPSPPSSGGEAKEPEIGCIAAGSSADDLSTGVEGVEGVEGLQGLVGLLCLGAVRYVSGLSETQQACRSWIHPRTRKKLAAKRRKALRPGGGSGGSGSSTGKHQHQRKGTKRKRF